MKTGSQHQDIETLRNEVHRLTTENDALKKRLSFLEGHETLSAGMRGEKLIASMLNGKLTSHTESFDVELPNGVLLEVKSSGLNIPSKTAPTRRWAWGKIFGEHGAKKFDYLVLVGVVDERYLTSYLDPTSPYVFFVVPYDQVDSLTIKNSKVRGIQLTTNPSRCTSAASPLFTEYQASVQQLKERFGL